MAFLPRLRRKGCGVSGGDRTRLGAYQVQLCDFLKSRCTRSYDCSPITSRKDFLRAWILRVFTTNHTDSNVYRGRFIWLACINPKSRRYGPVFRAVDQSVKVLTHLATGTYTRYDMPFTMHSLRVSLLRRDTPNNLGLSYKSGYWYPKYNLQRRFQDKFW